MARFKCRGCRRRQRWLSILGEWDGGMAPLIRDGTRKLHGRCCPIPAAVVCLAAAVTATTGAAEAVHAPPPAGTLPSASSETAQGWVDSKAKKKPAGPQPPKKTPPPNKPPAAPAGPPKPKRAPPRPPAKPKPRRLPPPGKRRRPAGPAKPPPPPDKDTQGWYRRPMPVRSDQAACMGAGRWAGLACHCVHLSTCNHRLACGRLPQCSAGERNCILGVPTMQRCMGAWVGACGGGRVPARLGWRAALHARTHVGSFAQQARVTRLRACSNGACLPALMFGVLIFRRLLPG